MSDKEYELQGSTLNYTVGFEGNNVYCTLIRRLKEAPLNQITKVVIKKTSMGSGDEISFRFYYRENGKDKKFPWIAMLITHPTTKEFLDDFKERLNSTVIWEDKRESGTVDESGSKVYDLQYLPFGYGGAGLSRGMQIWIYLICLAALVIPLIYFIKILATGGYRVYVADGGLTVKKFGSTFYTWEELEDVQMTRVKVVDGDNYSETQVLKVTFKSSTIKDKTVVMRYDHAVPMLKELAEREEVPAEYLEQFS